ncbi:TRAP transporter permease [Alkalilacustris brevis]|uniref:TRAP transporter permease n=1 Tax=Alkalilacustris brevis TaxID=2026338 RepID=UPI001390462E|nr:TRAP transporter fused permease subunit [Alkalilacustris brevis]
MTAQSNSTAARTDSRGPSTAMPAQPAQSGPDGPRSSWPRLFAMVVGMGLTIFGLINILPAYAFLPRMPYFPTPMLHSVMFGASLLIAILMVTPVVREGRVPPAAIWVMDVAFLAIGFYALYRYYTDVTAIMEMGLFFFAPEHAWIAISACAVIIVMCWRLWGAPLAIVGMLGLLYFFTGEHWPGIFRHTGMHFVEDTASELWFNTGTGVLGHILAILVNTVFPFIILGAMLEGTGGGNSLIKISFHAMRGFRGGPAHAAILSSSMFGTVSGSAVANVVGTGVITIPMIKRRGFSPSFAGGVEATASTGGQIMPPIMGAAALVMADFIGINYLTIIVAAVVPALAYYASLFVTVMFEARRLGVEARDDETAEDPIMLQDWINLILVIVPVTIVVVSLIGGASPAGSAVNALFVLIALSLLNPVIRRRPHLIIVALARGGVNFGRLLMAVGVVGIIVSVLSATGLPLEFAKLISGGAAQYLLVTLLLAAVAALALGMGMPTLPAYLTIVIIMGPALRNMGLTDLTAHFFVFYFGVASAITPPVAIAAYAAASIGQGGAMATAIQATRIGLVIFAIPFLFAFNPVMLIVPEAGGTFSYPAFGFMLLQLATMVYMLASAAAGFDRDRMTPLVRLLRAATGLAVISPDPMVSGVAVAAAVALVLSHRRPATRKALT